MRDPTWPMWSKIMAGVAALTLFGLLLLVGALAIFAASTVVAWRLLQEDKITNEAPVSAGERATAIAAVPEPRAVPEPTAQPEPPEPPEPPLAAARSNDAAEQVVPSPAEATGKAADPRSQPSKKQPLPSVTVEFVANEYPYVYVKVDRDIMALEPKQTKSLRAGRHRIWVALDEAGPWTSAGSITLEPGHGYRVSMKKPGGTRVEILD